MTNADDALAWRDLADQLTPEQVSQLEQLQGSPTFLTPARGRIGRAFGQDQRHRDLGMRLLFMARAWARVNGLESVASPPDATEVSDWDRQSDENNQWCRRFCVGESKTYRGASIGIKGRQYEDGSCERRVVVSDHSSYNPYDDITVPVESLSPTQTRQLATALREAADEAERLPGPRTTVPTRVDLMPGTTELGVSVWTVVGASVRAGAHSIHLFCKEDDLGSDELTPAHTRELADALDAGADHVELRDAEGGE
jgi:hypothetical protein